MKNKFQKLLKEFRELNLPDGRYAIYGSGPLGVRKIREVNDLDIIVTDELYQKLKEKYSEDAGKERIKIRTSSRTLFLASARNKNLSLRSRTLFLASLGIRTWLGQNLVPRSARNKNLSLRSRTLFLADARNKIRQSTE